MNEYLFALDLSITCTGVSVFDKEGTLIIPNSIRSDTKEKDQRKKIKYIAESLLELSKKYEPYAIVVEAGFSRFIKVTKALNELLGVVKFVFSDIPIYEIAPTSVRKILMNNGRAKKEDVSQYLIEKYPNINFKDYDTTDSLALGLAYFKREGII